MERFADLTTPPLPVISRVNGISANVVIHRSIAPGRSICASPTAMAGVNASDHLGPSEFLTVPSLRTTVAWVPTLTALESGPR